MAPPAKSSIDVPSDEWSSLTDHAPHPMVVTEGSGHVVRSANPAFCRLLNKSKDETLGKSFHDLLPAKDECLTLLDRVYQTGNAESHTERQRSDPPSVFWAYSMWPVKADKNRQGVVIQVSEPVLCYEKTVAMNEALMLGLVRQHEFAEAANSSNLQLKEEIGERRRAEEALFQAQSQLTDRAGRLEEMVVTRTLELTATSDQLEAFIYSIAHDLRAPLRAMQGFSTMLIDEAGDNLTKKGRTYAERINKAAQFMDALLRDLLAFSSVSQQNVELTQINLAAVVESVLARLRNDVQETKAQVEIFGPWPKVVAHEATLAQAVFNLLSNALKFVSAGVTPIVRVRTEYRAAFVRVWVEDNGPGIAANHQGEIFRPFTRLGGEKYAGTGIGLAIVQKGLERMGGRVGLESAPGQGSRFWFELRKA